VHLSLQLQEGMGLRESNLSQRILRFM